MNNKKIYIALISINVVIILFALIYINFYQAKFNGYIILPDNNVYYKKGNVIKEYEKNIEKQQKIKMFTMNNNYDLQFNKINGNIAYYKKGKEIYLDEPLLIAYSKRMVINLADFKKKDIDIDEINKVLEEHNISNNGDINVANKVSFDYNNDGVNEEIHIISNLFDQTEYDKAFSFVYYFKDNEIIYLLEQVDDYTNVYNLCLPYVDQIIKFYNDSNYNLILGCEYFSEIPNKHEFYKFNNNVFEKY